MTDISAATDAARPKTKTKREKKRVAWNAYAAQRGISPRTLDRWAAAGIVPKPEYINRRKYIDPDVEPKHDDAAE
jgi:hypothetical protein